MYQSAMFDTIMKTKLIKNNKLSKKEVIGMKAFSRRQTNKKKGTIK